MDRSRPHSVWLVGTRCLVLQYQLARAGWDKALEQPVFLALLPDGGGKQILDFGCGVGQLALHLANQGAAEVVGVDVSAPMLNLARSEQIGRASCRERV